MIRAIVTNGMLKPLDPLPEDWLEGEELLIDAQPSREISQDDASRLDRWYQELEASAAQLDPEDDRLLQEAVQGVRRLAKETARREMGLS